MAIKCKNENNRTERVIRNTAFSILFKCSDTFFTFILRTIFIKTLGITYLGINGLFTNILTVLSLMELGVGSAIVFSLYEPLAMGNKSKVAALMELYKRVYNSLGVAITIVGVALTPFLPVFVEFPPDIDNIYYIYWLTIANTSITYFLSYKRTLLQADQRSDINTKNQMLFRCIRLILLSLVLICTKNFILYLLSDLLNTLLSNIHISYVVKKRYPFLKGIREVKLEKEEKNKILKFMTSGIYMRIGQTIVTSTDSILISSFIGVTYVGLYSNYNLVYSGIDILIYLLFANVTASVGNYMVLKSNEDSENLFCKIGFINYVIVNSVTVCMMCLFSPFIQLWLGEGYLLQEKTVIVIVVNFYLTAMMNCVGNFIAAEGELTYINRYRPLVEGIINLIVSIILICKTNLGITAVFLGTTVCFVCGRVFMDPYVLYKYKFDKPIKKYIISYSKKCLLTLINIVVCKGIAHCIFNVFSINMWTWILVSIVCMFIANIVTYMSYKNTEEYSYFISVIKKIVNKKIKKVDIL